MKKVTLSEKKDGINTKDTATGGIVYTAVKTTGIFCHPSCSARTPKPENVVFYDTTRQALQNGFRPCKVCRPMEKVDITPACIPGLIKALHKNPTHRINPDDLKKRGIKPGRVEAWFKKYHHIPFDTYQRLLRINFAFKRLKRSEAATNTALVNRSESLNDFNVSYRCVFGKPPTDKKKKTVLNIVRFPTPLGPVFSCADHRGICLLDFTDNPTLEAGFKYLSRKLNACFVSRKNSHLDQVQSELKEYFEGNRKTFTVPLHTPGTDFQKSVWKILQDIPFGRTRSYRQQAITLGKPKAIRAVGSANGSNPISIIIPCHRVIGSDGSLTGYGGGLHRKKWLLDHEKANI